MDKDRNDIIEAIKKEAVVNRENRYSRVIDAIKNMKPFKSVDNIPSVPITSEEDYQNIVIPNFIRCGAIPKKDLVIGHTYIGSCRNADEAVWLGEVFRYKRTKFGYTYDEDINHFEDDDGYDVFVPIKDKETLNDEPTD